MTTTFGSELVNKTKAAKVSAIKARLKSAAGAAKRLEEDVRWLVRERAWEVLGYANFSEMWEKENGFSSPSLIKVMAAYFVMDEGMRKPGQDKKSISGLGFHSVADVARMIGYPVHTSPRGETSTVVRTLKAQKEHGVPPQMASPRSSNAKTIITEHGKQHYSRARAKPRRLGKTFDEFVHEGFNLSRREADEIADIAREADVPKAEIYRQAVTEYLVRYRASRPKMPTKTSTKR